MNQLTFDPKLNFFTVLRSSFPISSPVCRPDEASNVSIFRRSLQLLSSVGSLSIYWIPMALYPVRFLADQPSDSSVIRESMAYRR
jgi:hypothetical protein